MNASGNQAQVLPNTLYKYRVWHTECHRRLLERNEVYFASPSAFNDPFDCPRTLSFQGASAAEVRKKLRGLFQEGHPEVSRKEREAFITKRVLALRNPDEGREIAAHIQRLFFENHGILSLTGDPHNLIMWAHYGCSHEGFCVGLRTEGLARLRQHLEHSRGLGCDLYRVDYADEYPVFNQFSPQYDHLSMYKATIRTKSSQWQYEQEFRIIMVKLRSDELVPLTQSDRVCTLQDDDIEKIILGCRMPLQHKDEIKSVLRSKGCKTRLFQAELEEYRYGLKIAEVDY
jgi:hypothetical protein